MIFAPSHTVASQFCSPATGLQFLLARCSLYATCTSYIIVNHSLLIKRCIFEWTEMKHYDNLGCTVHTHAQRHTHTHTRTHTHRPLLLQYILKADPVEGRDSAVRSAHTQRHVPAHKQNSCKFQELYLCEADGS